MTNDIEVIELNIDDLNEDDDDNELCIDAESFLLEKADRSLWELYTWYNDGDISIDPEWQRNYVWDNGQASKLIESFLFGIPVPVIYLAKTREHKYDVIDGCQRLTSVFKYFNNEFKLTKLNTPIKNKYLGMFFKDLPHDAQRKLKKSLLRTFELTDSTGDVNFLVFERLNTGGTQLNEMEIRNCLYRGKTNSLIKELTLNKDFILAVNQDSIKNRMGDRNLVLRFLAFYEKTFSKVKSNGIKKFLNHFLKDFQNPSDDKIKEFKKVFEHCMRACVTVFGDQAFRLKVDLEHIGKSGRHSAGEWAARSNAVIFQAISTSFADYDIGQITMKADCIYESYVDMINNDKEWVDCVRRSTGESKRLRYIFETWIARLEDVMSVSVPQDKKRLFSFQLKKEMFQANPCCKICGQEIKHIDDAALDHDEKYWLGGQTIPENARLTHRLCNLKRG